MASTYNENSAARPQYIPQHEAELKHDLRAKKSSAVYFDEIGTQQMMNGKALYKFILIEGLKALSLFFVLSLSTLALLFVIDHFFTIELPQNSHAPNLYSFLESAKISLK